MIAKTNLNFHYKIMPTAVKVSKSLKQINFTKL